MKLLIFPVVFIYYEIKIIIEKFIGNNHENSNDKFFKKILNCENELSYKIINKQLILVESLINHPGYFFKNIIIANHLRKIIGCEIVLLINKNDVYANKLAKSFKIKNVIYFDEPNIGKRLKNFIIASFFFLKVKSIKQLLKLKYENIFLGKLVYDNILRIKKVGNFKKIDHNVFYNLLKFINSISFYENIFKENKIKYLIQDEVQFYPSSSLFQYSLKKKIRCYIKEGQKRHISLREYKSLSKCFENKSKFSKKLIKKLFKSKFKKKIVSSGKRLMNSRLKGGSKENDISDAKHFKEGYLINKKDLCKKYSWDIKKPIGLILANDLTDGVFANSWSLFRDNLSWLQYLLNNIKKNKHVNWIVKEHPSDKKNKIVYGTKYYFDLMINKNRNIKLLSNKINAKSLHKVVNFVFSSHGSAGLEYPFLGIPCVTSSDSLYHGLGFTHECKNLKELSQAIQKPEKLKTLNKRTYDLLCVYLDVYIHRTKILIGMPNYNPHSTIDYKKFNADIYHYCKTKSFYNKKFHKCFKNQVLNSYKHTLDNLDLN